MTKVIGVDSSTQSCKVVVRDADTGELLASGRAAHPDGSEVDPAHWWTALQDALAQAGGLDGVAAVSIAGQQHGMVVLDADGRVIRPALLWNDTRSAPDAVSLVERYGAQWWAQETGSVPVASFTVTKLAWLARERPDAAARVAQVMLPHDYLTWRLRGGGEPTTDRGDASGTGYFSPVRDHYLPVIEEVLGRAIRLPTVLGPGASPGTAAGVVLGAGTGDNMAAALGVGAEAGDVVVSIGTSGTVFAATEHATSDPSGVVAGFADASGGFLPLVCTLNASRVLDAACSVLGVGYAQLDELALSVADSGGLVLVPYLEGERTPNLPDATGSLHGLTRANSTPAYFARAAIEGMLCGLAAGMQALTAQGVPCRRVLLIGGGAQSPAVGRIAGEVFGTPVVVPEPGEYVAAGAARQAAWALTGQLPDWDATNCPGVTAARVFQTESRPEVLERYSGVQEQAFPTTL